MLWTTKLTESGYTESDFGLTFKSNVKKYNAFSDQLTDLKTQFKKATGDAKETIQEYIDTTKQAMEALNKKLLSNIKMMVANPDRIKANKERMASMHKDNKKAETVSTTAAETATPAEQTTGNETVVLPATVETTAAIVAIAATETVPATEEVNTNHVQETLAQTAATPATEQQPAETATATTQKQTTTQQTQAAPQQTQQQKPKPASTEKKKEGSMGVFGWVLLAFGLGAGAGALAAKFAK